MPTAEDRHLKGELHLKKRETVSLAERSKTVDTGKRSGKTKKRSLSGQL